MHDGISIGSNRVRIGEDIVGNALSGSAAIQQVVRLRVSLPSDRRCPHVAKMSLENREHACEVRCFEVRTTRVDLLQLNGWRDQDCRIATPLILKASRGDVRDVVIAVDAIDQ